MAKAPPAPDPRKKPASVVVTAGPTREYLDDIRFLTNASTGQMGIALARHARRRGARVTLVLGPSERPRPRGVCVVDVVDTQDLLRETRRAAKGADLVFFAAAPADWSPVRRAKGKPPREGGAVPLQLLPTPDVAATLGRAKGGRVHVGFALEVEGGERRARRKMERKGLDAIVLNGPRNLGRGGGDVWWIPRDGKAERLRFASKDALARAIVTRAWRLLGARTPPFTRGRGRAGRT